MLCAQPPAPSVCVNNAILVSQQHRWLLLLSRKPTFKWLIASLTMSAYLGPLGAAAAFGAIIMSYRWQRGQQEAYVRANMASALAVKNGCSLLQRSGLTWLVVAMTDTHSAHSPSVEATIGGFPACGTTCGKHTGC